MADSNCCEYFLDRTSSSANIASNRLGPWENASVKSLCIDWKFFEFCELNNSLKNQQDADICLKLKQENDRKTAARLRLEEREKKTNEEQSNKIKNVPTEELSKPIAGKKQLFIKSKSKSFVSSRVSTAQFYEGDSTSSSSINRRSNLHSANDVDLLNRIASASASASHSNKQPPPSNGSLFRTKSSFSIDDIKNLELIEKQIDKHLRELELKKTTKTATTCDSDNDSTTSLNEKETTSSDSSPSHIALYRIKKLEEMQRNVNQSRKRSSKSSSNTRTAFNRVACNQTPFDVKFFISTMTNEDRSSQSPPIINNDANNNRSKVAAEDNLNIKSRPLKSVSNVNITFDEKPPVEATMTTLAEQLTEIDNIRMQITNEFNQIISIAPLTRVKSVVFRHEEIENNKPRSPSIVVPTSTNNYHETTTVLQRPKSTINQRKTSKSVLSFGNSLPSSAVSNSRAGFAAKRLVSTKIGDFEESIEILNDADNKPMPQLQVRSESASSINTKAYPLFKTNVRPARQNSGNKKVFDLIRVDGKRYSTPENNYEINSRIFPRNNKDAFLVENKRTQVNSPDKKSSQFKLKEFSKIKSLIKPAYF